MEILLRIKFVVLTDEIYFNVSWIKTLSAKIKVGIIQDYVSAIRC